MIPFEMFIGLGLEHPIAHEIESFPKKLLSRQLPELISEKQKQRIKGVFL